ncbi:hypothetical protein MKW92_018441 [Papaver armeniacum]|nr:hypothetical protein MKW92_018441 [Papaver armeniacum]
MITITNLFCYRYQIQSLVTLKPFQIDNPLKNVKNLRFSLNQKRNVAIEASKSNSQKQYLTNDRKKIEEKSVEEGIPIDQVKTLVKFKSRYNYIRVIEVSRRADHPFAGSRLLLLDAPGNIHSVSFIFKLLTETYFDVFPTFPPILPPGGGPLGILGFGAGSAARIILELYPEVIIHGWELDPSVISVGREYFSLLKLENDSPGRLFINIGDGLNASARDGFSGILVDLFCKGRVIPELQDSTTWEKLKGSLRKGGRIMVNVGGSYIEAEDSSIDGKMVMEKTLNAMYQVFPGQLFVLSLGRRKEDSSIALIGDLPHLDSWRLLLPASLRSYVKMWTPVL